MNCFGFQRQDIVELDEAGEATGVYLIPFGVARPKILRIAIETDREGRVSVRNKALSLYDPLNGDGPWGLGTRVYERSCFRIKQLTQQYAWLTVIEEEPKPRFTFAVEGLPIRFYKGSPDDPPSNYLVTTYGELLQRQLFPELRPLDTTRS